MTTYNHTAISTGAAANAATFNSPLAELDAAVKKNEWAKTAAPTVNDDAADGYTVGSRWLNITSDILYVCVDSTAGAAVWRPIPPPILLTAMNFYVTSGSAAVGYLGSAATYAGATWRFDDSAVEVVGTWALIPQTSGSGSSINVTVWFAMESATTGNVQLYVMANYVADGADGAEAAAAGGGTVAVPGTAKYVKAYTATVTQAWAGGGILRLGVTRDGTHASDTATGDMHLLAVKVVLV